jgi:hypothetical protein
MNPLSLCCSVAWVEKVNSAQVVSILLAGATFVPLAVLLGRLFAARGITARDAAGEGYEGSPRP